MNGIFRRWRDARAYARISTPSLEWLRDHAARNGLDASREHCDAILARRARRFRGGAL